MIERLRKRFIRIATLAVAGVLLLLCVTVNAANYISADRQLTQMLRMICDNQGTVPHFPPDGGKHGQKPDGPFTPETPYSTRYFVLRYDGDGDLEQADLTHIAAVSEGDTAQYLTAALRHGAGFGYTAGYKYYVVHTDTNRWMAVFLDCYQQMHAVVTIAWMSLAAMASAVRGYAAGARLVRTAWGRGLTCREAAVQEGLFSPDAARELFDVRTLTDRPRMERLIRKYRKI